MQGSYTYVGQHTTKIECRQFHGILEEKSFLMIFDRHANLKYKHGNRNFIVGDII